ncbi:MULTISPECIES: hypothetical protein [Afipia]|uniref:hypothetical protein n=1 Tax=Afipia TaxID=1033 RepID=UPI0012E22939|nr:MULTISPECIES: hypothetical protein [Afipia]
MTTIYLALRKGLCGNAKYQEIPSHFICIGLSVPVALFVSHPVCGQQNVFQMIFDFSQCGGAEKRQVSTIRGGESCRSISYFWFWLCWLPFAQWTICERREGWVLRFRSRGGEVFDFCRIAAYRGTGLHPCEMS